MTISLFNKGVRYRRRIPRGVPHNLSPQMMHDIGLDPWPAHPRLPFDPLW